MDGARAAEQTADCTTPLRVSLRPEQIDAIAVVCHEANRAYRIVIGELPGPTWAHAPEDLRDSARDGVRFVLENPDAPQSAAHDNWLAFKRADGWSYGPTKDLGRKLHPCMVPYDDLQLDQRRKDALFRAIVQALTSVD